MSWKPKKDIPPPTYVTCPFCKGAGMVPRDPRDSDFPPGEGNWPTKHGNRHQRRRYTGKQLRAVLKLHEQGWSCRRIADLYPLSKSQVHRIVQEMAR
jgi:hypothetical protein